MPNTQIQLKQWELTLQCSVTDDHEEVIHALKQIASKWIFQKEDPSLYNEDDNLSIGSNDIDFDDDLEFDEDMDLDEEMDVDDMLADEIEDLETISEYDIDKFIEDSNDDEPNSDFFDSDDENTDYDSDEIPTGIHWQISLVLFKRRRKAEILKMLNQSDSVLARAHWSPTSNNACGSPELFYSQYSNKLDTRIDGSWDNRTYEEPIKIPNQIAGYEFEHLRPWQQEIIMRCKYPLSKRSINILVDKGGGIGKSFLTTWMLTHPEDCGFKTKYIPMCESYKDVMGSVYGMGEADVYLCDLMRGLDKNLKNIRGLIAGLEGVRNGIIHCNRFHWKSRIQNTSEIWIFSNTELARSLLSADRWIQWKIGDDDELYLSNGTKGLDIPIPEEEDEFDEEDEEYIDDIDNNNEIIINEKEEEQPEVISPTYVLQHADVEEPKLEP
ncbi:hypothetical protein OAA16_01030 [Candidatus Pelagibacter sp.]|nr:hypothetical protein [Candidatus Pelagibacter sp.]